MATRPVRIAVDIGGTFTDLECHDARSGLSHSLKAPTTPHDPSVGLIDAVTQAAARFGFAPGDVGLLIHGTTIATNAVLTRALPPAALIATAGFQDVLEIGRHARADIYALRGPDAAPLIPRRRRFGVHERIGADGAVVAPLDPASLAAAVQAVAQSGAVACAVALLNAFVQPAHEAAVRDALLARAPDLAVTCSHEVSPEIREFERTATTALNALLIPVMRAYVERLVARLAAAGIDAPLYLVQSNGGVIDPADAARLPVRLLLSGPSGGVLAAETLAARLGFADVAAVDMGGTSYDVAIIHDGRRATVAQGAVDGLPVRAPMVDMRTIGAGGGSIVSVEGGRLTVGPRSAGADPGPVCYGRGGDAPTVTDANLVLGRLEASRFLGGRFGLDAEGARAALQRRVADPLDLPLDQAAAGVLAVLVTRLAGAIRLSLFERGLDPRGFALMSYGGAGGLHAIEVAQELGMEVALFPRDPSTFSAHGLLQSDIAIELAQSRLTPLSDGAAPVIAALAAPLMAQGAARLEAARAPAEGRALRLSADLRYRGQAFELMLPLDGPPQGDADLAALRARFHALHRERFSFDDPGETVELVTLRLTALGALGGAGAGAPRQASPHPAGRRRVHLGGAWVEAAVLRQEALGPGARVAGPALIEQDYTTLALPAGWTLMVAPGGDMVARREGAR